MDCFGVLSKYHKTDTRRNWIKRGLIMNNFDELYEKYLVSSSCDKCQNPYKNRRDKCMDHSHSTNEFRNIICNHCNVRTDLTDNACGHINIHTYFDKRSGYEYWRIQIMINNKKYQKLFNKTKYSIEEVVLYRDAMYEDLGIEQFDLNN
jgi:hypothetical protein